jgi:hypothetical protein
MPSPLPRWDRQRDRVAPRMLATAAFPAQRTGRLPQRAFRGLLGVHLRYGLLARGVPKGPFPSEASAGSLPPLPLRLLPAGATVAGWELHPLKIDAFHGAPLRAHTHDLAAPCEVSLAEADRGRPRLTQAGLPGAGWQGGPTNALQSRGGAPHGWGKPRRSLQPADDLSR